VVQVLSMVALEGLEGSLIPVKFSGGFFPGVCGPPWLR
jgi:hypothetical protein